MKERGDKFDDIDRTKMTGDVGQQEEEERNLRMRKDFSKFAGLKKTISTMEMKKIQKAYEERM